MVFVFGGLFVLRWFCVVGDGLFVFGDFGLVVL